MKKLISITLALLLVFSLAAMVGCKSDEVTPSDSGTAPVATGTSDDGETTYNGLTLAELEASKPGEYLVEKCQAGMEVQVMFSGFVDNEAIMENYAGNVERIVTGYGATFFKTHADGDVATMISQVENYITMNVNMIFLIPPDGASVKDTIMKAQDAGILCAEYGIEDGQYTNATFGVQHEQGYICGEMAYQYAMLMYPDAGPGEIDVALLCVHHITPMMEKAKGIRQAINSHDVFNVVFYTDGMDDTIESGYNLAETVITANPNLRFIVSQNIISTIGICNYIESIPNVNMDEWAVISNSEHALLNELLAKSAAGTGPLRGTNIADMSEGAYIETLVDGLFTGAYPENYQLIFNYSTLTDGTWEFDMTSADVPPQDESLQYLYN